MAQVLKQWQFTPIEHQCERCWSKLSVDEEDLYIRLVSYNSTFSSFSLGTAPEISVSELQREHWYYCPVCKNKNGISQKFPAQFYTHFRDTYPDHFEFVNYR